MKVDLDELERVARAAGDSPVCGPATTLALIGRIRLLEASLRGAASIIEGTVQAHSQHGDYHDDLDWKAAQAMRRILENGVEIPPA